MKSLWRFTVSVIFLCLYISTVNTTETEEVHSNEYSPESLHSDEENNSNIINEDKSHDIKQDYARSLHDEYERRRRLQSIHDNLATKLQKALVKKLKSPEYSQRVNLTTVEKYLQHDIDVPSGRRSFNNNDNEANVSVTEDNPTEVDDGRRNYVKKVTYVVDQHPNVNSHAQVITINDGSLQDLQAIGGTRAGYTVVTNNGIKMPYQFGYNDPNYKVTSLPNYYVYGQPYLDFTNPVKMYYNYYPGTRFVKFNNNFFDYTNHVRAQNQLNDFKQITAYLTSLMNAENYINPNIILILKGANDLNLAEINNFDTSKLVQINKSDLVYLKKYIILILNKYGMTPYVFRLLEYVNLVEGRPRNEVHLVFKILSNQQAVYGLSRIESDQLKAHLQYILNEYGKSPYILPFVRNIGGIQFETRGNNRLYYFDFGNLDPSSHLNRDYMRKIYIHLSQMYNNNQFILQILQNVNRIYDNRNSITVIPKLDLSDYQNLYYLSRNDLYLLAKYISQIQKQRGDNKYLNELLIYINKLQTLEGTDINIIKDDHNIIKGYDLTGLYKILLDINNRNGLKPEIILIINRLINTKTVALSDVHNIINDLKILKDYLTQNQMYEYDQLLIKIIYELNNSKKDENLPPIEDNNEKWISVKIHDLELIYQYLLNNENFKNNPYLIVFVNQIIQIIQRSKLNPYANVVYKFRYSDLLNLYNAIQLYEKDKENPIYLLILHYLDQGKDDIPNNNNGTIPNDFNFIIEYFGDNQIDLNIIYKFLLYEIKSGNTDEVLIELLQLLKTTFLLPNGELKISILNLNETQSYVQINPNDLQKLYLYLQKVIGDKIISLDLIKFYTKEKLKYKLNIEILSNATKESLNRLRNFLLILIKEQGENPYVLEVLVEINNILHIPEENKFIINGTNTDVNEEDLVLLIKYISEVNLSDNNINLLNILKYLQDTKEKVEKETTKEWIYINAQDLELIYNYLLGKEKFLHSPYLALFVNEILPLIQRGKQNPYENIIYKFKHVDLLQLYKLVLSDEKDKDNPIYIKILEYLNLDQDKENNNEISPNVLVIKEYFGDQINLDLLYKFLTHEIKSGNTDTLVIELLQFIKRTLILPNGQLIIKIINLDDTKPLELIQPKDLQILYLYLQKIIKNELITVKLLEYMERQKQKDKLVIEIFSDVSHDTLIKIRNYLLTLLKEIGENQFVLDILFEVNNILGIPKTYDEHENALNGTKYEINEVGIKLLIRYFITIKEFDDNNDLMMILNYLYETENRIEKEKNKKDVWIYINVNDLEQIYEYLLGKEKFINSPYLVIFVNEILPIIQQGKLNPYENLAYKIRHLDLQKIFNLIITQEKDKNNPIYKKILKFWEIYNDNKNNNNGTTPNVDLHKLHEYFGEDQINLDIIYKFLIHEITSGNTNEVFIEFLQFIKNTLLLPNGLLKVKIIYFNVPELTGQINQNDLEKLFLYLQKLAVDENTRMKLLDYIKTYKQIFELFSNASNESLNRLRNFLLILIKESGKNQYITEVLAEINIILGIPESKNDNMYVLNGTNPEVNEEDLKLLIKYFSLINIFDKNTDVIKILEILHETEQKIKNKEEKPIDNWIYINAEDLQQIYQYLLGKEKFINSPYLVIFVNEILPFIQKAKQRQYENLLYKFKYADLLQIYNTLLLHEKDKENPIYIMILQYLDDFKDDTNIDGQTPDVDYTVLNEYFKDNKIDLDVLYKFLSHEIESGSHSKVLVQLLQLIQRTLLLPNGQLKVHVIYTSGTDPNIHPNDLQKLYFYLQKLIENEVLSIEFLDYIKKYKQKEKEMKDIFITVSPESLVRLQKFLVILIKEIGENAFIIDILLEINHILGVPENDEYPQVVNGTSYDLNDKDLDLLIKYFTEINIYGKNSDLINLLDILQLTKEKIKHDKEDSNGQWVSVNVHELEVIYQYLLSNEKFLNNPYVEVFINQIKPLINIGKEHPNEIVIYKFRAMDLLKIYKFLVSQEKDKENPIFIRILHYLEQATNNITKYDNGTNVDRHVLNEFFGDNQINLDIVYKFLLHQINIGKPNKILIELLDILKRIQLPNGQFIIKIINLNDTDSNIINPQELKEIYLYIQRIISDNTLSIDLLDYYTKNMQRRKQILEILSNTPKESLNRLRNYLLILLKEANENPAILEIILEINRILGIPNNDDKPDKYDINVNENDLEILVKMLSLLNELDNVDVVKIIENVIETKKRIKEQQEIIKQSKLFNSYVSGIIDNKTISPAVKLIIESLLEIGFSTLNQTDGYYEFDTVLREAVAKLNKDDLNVLIKYLQILTRTFRPVYLVEHLMPYVEKILEDYKNDTNHKNTTNPNETIIVNITRHDLDVFNKYLLELIKLYGENSNIIHIIYKINNIKEIPGTDNDWFKLVTKNTNLVPTLKVSDIKEIINYLLSMIKKQGATVQLIKILRDISKLPQEIVEDTNRKVTPIDSTHALVILDNEDVNKIKSYLVKIINDYGSNPFLVNILKIISLKEDDYNVNKNKPNIYTFPKLNQNDLKILTTYILDLIDKQGASPELIEILYLIYEINGDVNEERKNVQYVLEISKEIKKLRDNNIIQTMRNMDRNTLITIYIDMLETIFSSPNIDDYTRIMVKLLEMYKKEESPIKKYIILKWYEHLIRNKGVSYKTLRNPDFINNLLELDNEGTDQDVVITTEKYKIVTPYDYSSDIDKILSKLIDNTLRNKPLTNDSSEEDIRNMNNNTDEGKTNLRERIEETETELKSCIEVNRKFKETKKSLRKIKKKYRHDIHFSNHDLERIFDIVVNFAKQLKHEKNRNKIHATLVIDELENRLQSQHTECKRSDTVNQIISTVVVHLRDIISYLKSTNFSKDEIMVIIKSTLEDDIMPDIRAISIQECTATANKEILEALLTNVYAKTYEKDDKGSTEAASNNVLEKLSTKDLLKEISKVKNLPTAQEKK